MLKWLEKESPEYWRRAWLWVMRADLGDPADLVKGPSRDWSINWIVSGYPADQLVYILSRAEEAALGTFDLQRLIRLRCLKTRALSARKYQSNEWGRSGRRHWRCRETRICTRCCGTAYRDSKRKSFLPLRSSVGEFPPMRAKW